MSNEFNQPSGRNDSEIPSAVAVEATVAKPGQARAKGADREPSAEISRGAWTGIAIGTTLIVVLMVGAIGYIVSIYWDSAVNPPSAPTKFTETPNEKYDYVASAFSDEIESDAEHVELANDLFRRIRSFSELYRGHDRNDDEQRAEVRQNFYSLLDIPRLKTQIVHSRIENDLPKLGVDDLSGVEAYVVQRQLNWLLNILEHAKADVAAVRPIENGEELLVYAMLTNERNNTLKVRIWTKVNDQQLQMFDFEVLKNWLQFSLYVGIELCGTNTGLSIDQEMRIDQNKRLLRRLWQQTDRAWSNRDEGDAGDEDLDRIKRSFEQIDSDALDLNRQVMYWVTAARLQTMLGNYPQALDACEQLTSIYEKMPEAWLIQSEVFRLMKEYEKSNACCNTYERAMGPDDQAKYLTGLNFVGMGKTDQAREAFEHALTINPEHRGAKEQLSQLLNNK